MSHKYLGKYCYLFILSVILTGVFVQSCTDTIVEIPMRTNVVVDDNNSGDTTLSTIIIVDATGKAWDISHAVHEYGFDPEKFDFGLGPKSIRPIQNPTLVSEGQQGYPPNDWTRIVIGTAFNGDPRAYALEDMRVHEVVDEQFGDAYVAVAY